MKKKLTIVSLILACVMAFVPLLVGSSKVYAQASYSLQAIDWGDVIQQGTQITDTQLYTKLSNWASRLQRGSLKERTFATGVDVVDLSASANTTNKIKSLSGITSLDMTGVKVLKLSNNDLGTLTSSYFKYMTSLEALYLDNCNLTSLDLSGLDTLRYLNVKGNNLTTIKLNKIVINTEEEYVVDADFTAIDTSTKEITWERVTSTTSYVNLSNNNIVSLDDITFPARDIEGLEIDLYNNGITANNTPFTNIQLNLGFQGLTNAYLNSEIVDDVTHWYAFQNTKFYYTQVNDAKLSFVFERKYTENGEEHVEVFTINDAEYAEPTVITLGCGEYKCLVIYDSVPIKTYIDEHSDDQNAKKWASYYSDKKFSVIPSTPSYKFVINGVEQVEVVDITSVTKVNFSADEGAEIYYKLNDATTWVKGTSVTITKGGNTVIHVKSVFGDYESKEKVITLYGAASLRIPSVLVLLLVVGGLLALAFVVGPLIRRYVIKE